jgi:uncharacterized glyoxalase superfamily protein PhnB
MDLKAVKRMDNLPECRSIVPVFSVADVASTIKWYEDKFGFRSEPFPAREPYVFAMLFCDNIEIMLQLVAGYRKPDVHGSRSGGVWDAYIRSVRVKELYERIKDDVTILKPLRQQPYGAWEFEVKDPNGHVLVFSEI